MGTRFRRMAVAFFAVGVCLWATTNGWAQQFLWQQEFPEAQIDTGALLDVNIPGVTSDVVILGATVLTNTTTAGGTLGSYVIGLDSKTGNYLYAKAVPVISVHSNYVVSIQALPDKTGDNVEEALVRVRFGTTLNTYWIQDEVINGATGDSISTTTLIENVNEPVARSNHFQPIFGDYDGDGKKGEFLIRTDNFVPNVSSERKSRVWAIK